MTDRKAHPMRTLFEIIFVGIISIAFLANITASALWLAGIGAYLISFIVHLFL
jgi:hypothetical protein